LGLIAAVVGFWGGGILGATVLGGAAESLSEEPARNAYNRDKDEFLKEVSSAVEFLAGLEQLQKETPRLALDFKKATPTMPALKETIEYR
jgi:hypothetical protein